VSHLSSLILAHKSLLGDDPSPVHTKIYEAFPATRGIASRETDPTVFEATLMLAIVQTYPRKQRPDPYRCFFFVRPELHPWALEQLRDCAQRMFWFQKQSKNVAVAKHLGAFLRAISIGSRVLHFAEAPERWVAFGFDKTDPVPEWVKGAISEP
jgi:hypothetical protein